MDTSIIAALIGAGVAALGFGATIGFTLWYDHQKERKERGRVASAILVELMAQSDMARVFGEAAHLADALPVRENFARVMPAQPTVYVALADRLPLLPANCASRIVAFYGALAWARELVTGLPTTAEFSQARNGHVEKQASNTLGRLQQATSGAAYNAMLAIRGLDEVATHKRLLNDETIVADTLRKLEQLAQDSVQSEQAHRGRGDL
jgi:hypothetical protein